MVKPVIFSIDDDPSVLSAIERDLRAHYGQDWRQINAALWNGRVRYRVTQKK